MRNLAIRVGLTSALLALASCGGSSDGPLLALAPAGVAAPCATAFDDVTSSASKSLVFAKDDGPVVLLSLCKFDAQRNVTIGGAGGCGPRVEIDQSFTAEKGNALGKITIASGGKVAVPHTISGGTLEVETTGIVVEGSLSIGTETCPVGGESNPSGRVRVTFTGDQPIPKPAQTDNGSGADKGIELRAGGTLRLYGAKGLASDSVNWTQLSQPAGPAAYEGGNQNIKAPVADGLGGRRLRLAADVRKGASGGWQKGDWIVVATSSFSPFESEFVQIASVEAGPGGGSIVDLVQPLRHYHFGSADPGLPSDANFGADASTNFGVDERSEVGLISRAITFTSRTPATARAEPDDQNNHWGGEIRILSGYKAAMIQGVELEKFGKARLGSYPIHFHMTGPAGPHLIDSNSIHHSYNKCVTVHMSEGVKITNNVCARAVGHLFYQEIAEEQGGQFIGNLGVGAMSHNFGLDSTVPKAEEPGEGGIVLVKNYWEGDYLGRKIGYDGLKVPNLDSQSNPMRGSCYVPDGSGGIVPARVTGTPPCAAGELYSEPPSGFWLGNPGTVMTGNSIGGCQGTGKAYWYVPPKVGLQKHETVVFENNRAHACFDGLFTEEEAPVVSEQLFPTVGGVSNAQADSLNVISHFKGFTATRIRNRGVWVRPVWTAVENGRFATNRESVTLVSSGGTDGNAAGVWSLLKDSVLVGLSNNNVDRWGPCPPKPQKDGFGCVDKNPLANDVLDKGYQSPRWNSAGYMIYDGPVRIIHNHFVNFLVDIKPLLTEADQAILRNYKWPDKLDFPSLPATEHYEGDAALGWFQSNQSAYPTATVTKALSFDNVDLRHQIYTERVNVNTFKDGDKNTAVIDLDGTLTGYRIVDENGVPIPDEFPISLNNLPFNRTGNSVDECLATGQQDEQFEGRATSIISPANMATLEFEALYPGNAGNSWQDMVFVKDNVDSTGPGGVGVHEQMRLQSRNGLGVWEPKVASGGAYTVRAAPSTEADHKASPPPTGIPGTVRVGFTDAVMSKMSPQKAFNVRVGICYTDKNTGAPPNTSFKITRGYKSWGGNGANFNNPLLQKDFNYLDLRYDDQTCINLDGQNPTLNFKANGKGCPAAGVIPVPVGGVCPAGSTQGKDRNQFPICVFPRKDLAAAASIAEITNPNGTPVTNPDGSIVDKYYYDNTTGMLFFNVIQDSPNAHGVGPLGSCRGQPGDDPACPGAGELETYFPCPAQGCTNYSVVVDNGSYSPGASACDARGAGGSLYGANGTSGYTVPEPVIANRLGELGKTGPAAVVQALPVPSQAKATGEQFLRWLPNGAPTSCPVNAPPVRSMKVASAANPRYADASVQPARWLRGSFDWRSLLTWRGSQEWFSARRSTIPDVGSLQQICSAAPT